LKPGKIKLEVFLNLKSKKKFKSEKWFCTLPPQLKMPPAPLPPGKKKFFCTLPPQLIMPPAPLPPGKKEFFCTLPPQLIIPPAPLPPGNNSFISLYAKVSPFLLSVEIG
jgi:hypothetical protein